MFKDAVNLILKHEGLKLKPYQDKFGNISIGIGRNLTGKGITKEEAFMLFENDVIECETDLRCKIFSKEYFKFKNSVRLALLDMRFQLGFSGFRSFKKMIKALKKYDYELASEEAEKSKWFNQVPTRAKEIVRMLKGEYECIS